MPAGIVSRSHSNSDLLVQGSGRLNRKRRMIAVSLFGELGLAYTYKTSSLQLSGSTSSGPSTGTGKSVGTRTAVGVVIWF